MNQQAKSIQRTSRYTRRNIPKISLIIPALNEEKNLPHILPRVPSIVDEVILVDGSSTDRTLQVARELCPDIKVVYQDGKGKGNAIRCGVQHATGDIIVMIDADVSMDPEEIPLFIEPLLGGFDLTKGSRFISHGGTEDMERYRRWANRLFLLLVNRLFHGKYTDLCYGFNAFWRHAYEKMDIFSEGFEIETELNIKAIKAGLKVTEVASYEEPRLHGRSNLKSLRDGFRILSTIFRLYFWSPTRRKSVISVK